MRSVRRSSTLPWVSLPALGWFLLFVLVPLAVVVFYSLAQKGPYGGIVHSYSFENYARAADWLYLRIFLNSVRLAALTALSCLVLGYPMAYAMATAPGFLRPLLVALVVIPFWTNFVIRVYAIKSLLSDHGPVAALVGYFSVAVEPGFLSISPLAVWVGMITNYLPFMVLPLYVVLEKFDFTLLEAARDLGATSVQILARILLPLTKQGVFTGLVLVFTPALGEFVIPDLLGGARVMMIGNLVTEQFLKTRDWPFGAALSLILIAAMMVSLVVYVWNSEADDSASGRGRNGF